MHTRGSRSVLVVLVVAGLVMGLVGFSGDTRKISDLQIETTILQRLKTDTRLDARKIRVKSEKHRVTLEGIVDTLEEKYLAERIVGSTIVGVRRITNLIQVMRPVVIDTHLATRVRAELKKAPGLKSATIKATVEKGTVFLAGEVKNAQQRRLAEQLARSVVGVLHVESALAVAAERMSDEDIAQEVALYLESSPLVDHERITVSVKDGVVRLTGEVDHLMHLLTLVEDIKDLRGVRQVEPAIELRD